MLSRNINIRIVSDNGTPATQTPIVLTQVGISQRRTNLDLPNDFTTASTDPKNFKIDVFDDKAVGGTITAKLKMLKPDGTLSRLRGNTTSSASALARRTGFALATFAAWRTRRTTGPLPPRPY